MELRHQHLSRYIVPLREGGSLPALAEADDDFKYVVKFRGAGHGPKALIAELIGGEMARALGFNVPELVFLDVDEDFGRTEGDEEIQDLLRASQGLNLGLHFLSGALTLDAYVNPVDELLASKIVWLDSYLTNVDRTTRNTNMLVWNHETWLIDHGASLYFQHSWHGWEKAALSAFPYVKDHALIRKASKLAEADGLMRSRLSYAIIDGIVNLIPDEWLQWDGYAESPSDLRNVYSAFLKQRLDNADIFVNEAVKAHGKALV